MLLRDVAHAVRHADIASLPLAEACRALADLPAAKQYNVSPSLIWRAVRYVLPPEQADELIQLSGIRRRVRLADLAYLAQYDQVLRRIVAALLYLMEDYR